MTTTTQYICPECSRVLRTASAVPAGKKIRCPGCQTVFAPAAPDPRPASPIRRSERDYPAARRGDDYDDPPARRRRPVSEYAAEPRVRRRVLDDDGDDLPRSRSSSRAAEGRPRRERHKGSAL